MMDPSKVSKVKRPSYGIWKYPCSQFVRGDLCGGELRTRYDKRWEQLDGAPPGTPDPYRPYRPWVCNRCKYELRQALGPGALYSPSSPRPDISEYSQRVSRDPYRAR